MNNINNIKLIETIIEITPANKNLIIGIDGLGGAGKSTISEKIRSELINQGYSVHLLHIDDFIHPKEVRYNRNYPEWECYYNLQWRYGYLREILEIVKNSGDIMQNIELYDKENDTYFTEKINITSRCVIILEGIFLQRKELKNLFDFMIYIDIPENIRLNRVLVRDKYIGDEKQIRDKYANRYFPAERYYIRECAPVENADYVIKD